MKSLLFVPTNRWISPLALCLILATGSQAQEINQQPLQVGPKGTVAARYGAFVPNSRWGGVNRARQVTEQMTDQAENTRLPSRLGTHVPNSRWGRPDPSTPPPQGRLKTVHAPGATRKISINTFPTYPRSAVTVVSDTPPAPVEPKQPADQPVQDAVTKTQSERMQQKNNDGNTLRKPAMRQAAKLASQVGKQTTASDAQPQPDQPRGKIKQSALYEKANSPKRDTQVQAVNYQAGEDDTLIDPFQDEPVMHGPFEVIDDSGEMKVTVRRSKLLRTKFDIYRTAVVDPQVCDIVQFTPREISIIGRGQGATHVTFWFKDGEQRPLTYLVRVVPDPVERQLYESEYEILEEVLTELFPDSKVQLILVADKLIVRGQAKDVEEAAQIMHVIRGQFSDRGGNGNFGNVGAAAGGTAAQVLSDQETGGRARPQLQVINMLRVPGAQQVALRVKIAELNRTAARGFGAEVDGQIDFTEKGGSALFLNSLLGITTGGQSLLTQFDGDDIRFGLRFLEQHGVVRMLSEPTVVTLSGRSATFVAGGEFAVPTVVGGAGINAISTDFRAFGAVISFLPTVIDKDRIRLQVSPEFSQINAGNTVGGTPGLDVRAVSTTVEMREGQTLAIAGLLEESTSTSSVGRIPFVSHLLGTRDSNRTETELIILVTPELLHPMEPEEVPPLPGFDVTEPDNWEFFVKGRLEGTPTRDYRSTVWPRLRWRYKAGGTSMISGPFGHGN